MTASVDPKYSVAGFLVGLLVGQTGMGGAALMTPVLILLFGVHPATAVGIDLLYASMTKITGCEPQTPNVTLLALDQLASVEPMWIDAGPFFSALFKLWLSMMHAVRLASRSACSRHLT
jgi:hypothetical protein